VTRSSIAIVAILVFAASALAQTKFPAPTGFVNDLASVIDPASKERMETMSRNFRDRTQIDVAVVTLPSLEGRAIEDVGIDLAREWKIGGGEEKDGILVLLAPNDRQTRIETSRKLDDEITDGQAGAILRDARPLFAGGQYGAGLSRVVESVYATIAKARGISIEGIDAARAYPARAAEPSGGQSPLDGIIGLVVVFGLFWLMSKLFGGGGGGRGGRRRRYGGGPWIIPFPIGGGWGGGGGGGWSGGGGGSSWGGFGGGGDFGGGGASDSW
jgi:uncharacterized protein